MPCTRGRLFSTQDTAPPVQPQRWTWRYLVVFQQDEVSIL
jgi:hypothetical protein